MAQISGYSAREHECAEIILITAHGDGGRVMNRSTNVLILYWQVSVVSVRAAAGLNVSSLVEATLKCSLHDLIPLINTSQTAPGFSNPLTPLDPCTPEDPNRDLMATWSMLLATVCVCVSAVMEKLQHFTRAGPSGGADNLSSPVVNRGTSPALFSVSFLCNPLSDPQLKEDAGALTSTSRSIFPIRVVRCIFHLLRHLSPSVRERVKQRREDAPSTPVLAAIGKCCNRQEVRCHANACYNIK